MFLIKFTLSEFKPSFWYNFGLCCFSQFSFITPWKYILQLSLNFFMSIRLPNIKPSYFIKAMTFEKLFNQPWPPCFWSHNKTLWRSRCAGRFINLLYSCAFSINYDPRFGNQCIIEYIILTEVFLGKPRKYLMLLLLIFSISLNSSCPHIPAK